MKTYKFFTDAGHGWLQVPHSELQELGLTTKISPYSYRDRNFAYLEEDCDAGLFFEAKGWESYVGNTEEIYHDNSPVREMEEY